MAHSSLWKPIEYLWCPMERDGIAETSPTGLYLSVNDTSNELFVQGTEAEARR